MKTDFRTPRQGAAKLFAVPALIAIASIAGLVIGLTGEGAQDWLSWTLLLLPLAAAASAFARRG